MDNDESYKKGYEQAKTDFFRELGSLILFYYDNGQKTGGDALVHARTVLRALKDKKR